jgi:DNA-binding CsgD family transcriptional regulator
LSLIRVGARAAADLASLGRAGRDERHLAVAHAGWSVFAERTASAQEAHAFDALAGPARTHADAELALIEAERCRIEDAPEAAAWRDAVDKLLADGRPYPLAYARWRLAEALLGAGDRGGATEELRAAYLTTIELGAAPMRAAIEGLAARARLSLTVDEAAPVAAPAASDPFGLTPREREVLVLVSTGRTNRQIADELFISESTAGVHVSNILGKLGVATRTEAASVAVKLNLDQA